jgi:tetratricopeptide (TPR) repeat protein
MRAPLLLATLAFIVATVLPAAETGEKKPAELEAAMALVKSKRYPEACDALEKIIAGNPRHAAACHQLGLVLKLRNDPAAFEEAVKWLAQAVELEPNNWRYLGDFGGTSLEFASRTRSLSAATRGREAMEKAINLNPDYLEAREGLFQFYQRAPWPIGSNAKAAAQLEEIRKRNPDLATILGVVGKTNTKEYASAFKLCDEVLTKKPNNYIALYHYGRTAAMSGQNLDRGLTSLQQCLTLDPPTPASPSHSNVWQRIGNIQEKRGRPNDARTAYEAALKLDSGNSQASEALAKLK